MLRCPGGPVGRFRVEFRISHHPEEYAVEIGSHHAVFQFGPDGKGVFGPDGAVIVLDGAPVVTNKKPFEGELCEHELWWLQEGIPGRDYRPEYEFTVTALP